MPIIESPNQDTVLNKDFVIANSSSKIKIRLDHETGGIIITNSDGELVFHLQMPNAAIRLGGQGRDGDLLLFPRRATNITVNDKDATLRASGDAGLLSLGGGENIPGVSGQIIVKNRENQQTIFIGGQEAEIVVGGNGEDGRVFVRNAQNNPTIDLDGQHGNVDVGGNGEDGDLNIRDQNGRVRLRLQAQGGDAGPTATITVGDAIHLAADTTQGQEPDLAILLLGGNGNNGRLNLFRAENTDLDLGLAGTVELDARHGSLRLGNSTNPRTLGQLFIHPAEGEGRIQLSGDGIAEIGTGIQIDGNGGNIRAGGGGSDGDLVLFPEVADDPTINPNQSSIHLSAGNGEVRVGGGTHPAGTHGPAGKVFLRNSNDETTIHLDGDSGDIVLQNADCAEEFELEDPDIEAMPGDVMTLSDDGKLKLSDSPYDKKVVGIIAGTGDLRPGIVLGRRKGSASAVPITLVGRTYCKVDASRAPIHTGDMLTTSPTLGVAMKAIDRDAAFGAVIGKALRPLTIGTGMVPVLVALQ